MGQGQLEVASKGTRASRDLETYEKVTEAAEQRWSKDLGVGFRFSPGATAKAEGGFPLS